jgi:predicted ATPase
MADTLPVAWDKSAVKCLLRDPTLLQQREACWSWIQERGGLKQVVGWLRALPLPPDLDRLRQSMLDAPGQKAELYARRLNISVATYYRWLDDLAARLLAELSVWPQPAPDQDGRSAQPLRWQPASFPAQTSLFVGREQQVAALRELLQRPEVRLVTLTGPGGIGKTCLAIQALGGLDGAFGDGILFVALASIRDPELLIPAVIQALGLPDAGPEPGIEWLSKHLRRRELLLVLDNLEQLVAAATLVGSLLAAAPRLKVLATSRIVLHLRGEHEFPVPPLALPPLPLAVGSDARLLAELERCEAVRLFLDRAQNADPAFRLTPDNAAAVAEICRRLDGLPLAIELAAARVKVLSPQAMAARQRNRLALLAGGAVDLPPHQRTLRGTLDWSYDLLGTADQHLFRQLAVFAGGFTLEDVTQVCQCEEEQALARLASLIDNSMLQRQQQPGGEIRFSMLETIRDYGQERLEQSGELEPLRRRHARYYLALVEAAEPELTSGPRQRYWRDRLMQDYDNIREALSWSLGGEDRETGLRIAGALWRFWLLYSHFFEGRKWMDLLQAQSADVETPLRCKVLYGAGWLAYTRGEHLRAWSLFEQALELARRLGLRREIGMALHGVGELCLLRSDFARARRCFEESLGLFRALDDQEEVAWALYHLGWVEQSEGNFAEATRLYEACMAIFRTAQVQRGLLFTLVRLAEVLPEREHARIEELLAGRLAWFRELDDQIGVGWSLMVLGMVALRGGRSAEARGLFDEALAVFRKLEDNLALAATLGYLGHTALAENLPDEADAWYSQSLAFQLERGSQTGMAECLEGMAAAAVRRGAAERAALLCGAAEALLAAARARRRPAEQERHDQTLALIRARLSEEALGAAFDEGAAQAQTIAACVLQEEGCSGAH